MMVLLVVDRVLIRVTVGREARWSGKEVLKGGDVNHRIEYGEQSRSG